MGHKLSASRDHLTKEDPFQQEKQESGVCQEDELLMDQQIWRETETAQLEVFTAALVVLVQVSSAVEELAFADSEEVSASALEAFAAFSTAAEAVSPEHGSGS